MSQQVRDAEQALGHAKVAEAREQQRLKAATDAAKALASQALNHVRAYADQVAQAVKAASALKPGPPAPAHVRNAVRGLLHAGWLPPMGGNGDATLEGLFTLRERGIWLYDHLEGLDDAGRAELDVAESAAHAAMIARAKIVAGEV